MGFPLCVRADIFEVYATSRDNVSQNNHVSSRGSLPAHDEIHVKVYIKRARGLEGYALRPRRDHRISQCRNEQASMILSCLWHALTSLTKQWKCGAMDLCCSCSDMDTIKNFNQNVAIIYPCYNFSDMDTVNISSSFHGSKRKLLTDTDGGIVVVLNSDSMARSDNQLKPNCNSNIVQHWEVDSAMNHGGIKETTDDQYGGMVNKPSQV